MQNAQIEKAVAWNPWHGCKKASPGGKNCFVYKMDKRYGRDTTIITKGVSAYELKDKDCPPRSLVKLCFSSELSGCALSHREVFCSSLLSPLENISIQGSLNVSISAGGIWTSRSSVPKRYSTNSNNYIKRRRASVFSGKGDAGWEVLTIFGGCPFVQGEVPGWLND